MRKKYDAMVLSCIDPRCQTKVFNILKKKKLTNKYSAFNIAGAAVGVTAKEFKTWHKVFWDNLDISVKLHKIKKLIIFNHTDCGAAKIVNGKKEFSKQNEDKIHKVSFKKIKTKLLKKYPKFKIEFKIIKV